MRGGKQREIPKTWVYQLLFGLTAKSACVQENQQFLVQCKQTIHSHSLSPHHCGCRWWTAIGADDKLQFSPKLESPGLGGRANDTLLFAQACAERTAWSLWVCWRCNVCVLKMQSQLILQDFMLQTLKSLNNNILSAFYVAPVNPEGPKTLQKLCGCCC